MYVCACVPASIHMTLWSPKQLKLASMKGSMQERAEERAHREHLGRRALKKRASTEESKRLEVIHQEDEEEPCPVEACQKIYHHLFEKHIRLVCFVIITISSLNVYNSVSQY